MTERSKITLEVKLEKTESIGTYELTVQADALTHMQLAEYFGVIDSGAMETLYDATWSQIETVLRENYYHGDVFDQFVIMLRDEYRRVLNTAWRHSDDQPELPL